MTPRSERTRAAALRTDMVGGEAITALFAAAGLALVTARHVLPAESAHLGETLWIVALWLLLAVGWAVVRTRLGAPLPAWDRADLAVALLAGGHALSGLLSHGNQRSAWNGVWEWIAVAVSVGLMRRWLSTETRWQQWLALIATLGVVLAGLGVQQYAVTNPALRAQVYELMQLEEREHAGELAGRDIQRYRELRSELGQLATESDPNTKLALRQRLLASTEPLACFALTNTLAGVLSVAVLLLAGAAFAAMDDGKSRWHIARIIVPALLVAFCLVLTKSRTAWAGTVTAGAMWTVVAWRGIGVSRRTLSVAIGGLLVAGILVGAAWLAGALDLLVLLESSKSLRYRMEYWTGAWGVIRDHLFFGVGPGNFRQNYLRHKVAGSSEEILDPHNLFLDVWASGGLIALAGLLLAAGLAIARWRQLSSRTVARSTAFEDSERSGSRRVMLAGVFGILLVSIKQMLIDMQGDPRLLGLACGWIVASLVLPRMRFSPVSQAAAGLALAIHLLGAGGVGMPVIATTLLLLWLGPARPPVWETAANDAASAIRRQLGIAICVLAAGAMVWCLTSTVIPATLSNLYSDAAVSVMMRGDVASARRFLVQAIDADPSDPEPHMYLAQLEHDQSRLTGNQEAAARAEAHISAAIALDPENPKSYWQQAKWNLELASQSDAPQLLAKAVTAAEAAAQRDPHNVPILATLANAYERTGQTDAAREIAARALALDEQNRALGHTDKLLDEQTLDSLKTLSESPRR